ncbi:MAG: glycerophosphodiester phosphodiesterase family protein, partial [Tepidiformaceae bacterium]
MQRDSYSPLDFTPTIAGRRRVICCHRSQLSGRFPSNSLAAVEECVAAGAARLETDVRFLPDDSMLLFHGTDLDHGTTGTGKVDALSYNEARQIRYCTPGSEPLCFLEEVVRAMQGSGATLQVDLTLMRPISPHRVRLLADA